MVSFTPRSRSYSGLKPSSSTAGVMSHCQLRCFIILYLSELSVLVLFCRFAQNSASKDTTFNTINGHLKRITNGLPNSFLIKSEKHGCYTPSRQPGNRRGGTPASLSRGRRPARYPLHIQTSSPGGRSLQKSPYAAEWTLP